MVHVASLSGGAGGGLTDRIIERQAVDYSKQTRVMLGVFPSNNSGQNVVQDYNCVLSAMGMVDHLSMMVML